MIAETGAKNGWLCPATSVAIRYAAVAATDACTIERQATRRRSKRVRIDVRDRSAAPSISAPPRSASREGASGMVDGGTERRRRLISMST